MAALPGLSRLSRPDPAVLRGAPRVTLLCDPVRADVAARDIRRKKTGYLSDATQRARIGQIEDAEQTAEYRDVLQQEADLIVGHGVLRYVGLIAISAPGVAELDAAVAGIEQAAIQASCETRASSANRRRRSRPQRCRSAAACSPRPRAAHLTGMRQGA